MMSPVLGLGAILLAFSFLCVPASAQPLPPWWEYVSDNFAEIDGVGPLRQCFKRNDVPPNEGQICSRNPKTCYFGLQQCPGIGDFPAIRCRCDGSSGTQRWSCDDAICPIEEPPGNCCLAEVNSDPHFFTWQTPTLLESFFGYHAECDIVLIKNPALDLDLHIRTSRPDVFGTWAVTESAALRIGANILEVQSGGTYYFNGDLQVGPSLTSISGFPVTYADSSSVWESFTLLDILITVQLDDSQYITFSIFNWSVNVRVYGCDDFANSVGFFGTFCDQQGPTDFFDRDQTTSYKNEFIDTNLGLSSFPYLVAPDTYAQQWQVDPTIGDPLLFLTTTTNTCTSRRRLQESGPTEEDVAAAIQSCSIIGNPVYNDACVFDVASSGDERWAFNPVYSQFVSQNGTVISADIIETPAPSGSPGTGSFSPHPSEIPSESPSPIRTISGQVLEDTTNDNIGDTPLPNVKITVLDPSGVFLETKLTDANGLFAFSLPPGIYWMVESNLPNYIDISDSDGDNDNQISVDVRTGDSSNNEFWDVLVVPPP